jgi:hypothetical protein
LWPERLKIAIGPARVDVVRTSRRAAAAQQHSLEYAPEEGQGRTHAVEAALGQALETVGGRRIVCSVVLSNSFARYGMLPWRDEVTSGPARAAYARAHLTNTYGTATDSWEFVRDESAYGEASAICALDRELLLAIRRAVRHAGCRLTSVQPYFSAAFNRCRREFNERDHWFAVAERDRVCLARVANRALKLLRAQRVTGSIGAELAAMMERESLAEGNVLAETNLYLFAPGMSCEVSFLPADVRIRQLDAGNYLAPVDGDARYAMALA